MTEAEWLACDEPERMLKLVAGDRSAGVSSAPRRASDRKLRLLACAFSRLDVAPRAGGHPTDPRSRAIRAAERIADGANPARYQRGGSGGVYFVLRSDAREAAELLLAKGGKEPPILAALLRDLFGNPCRPVTLDPNTLSPTVSDLAQAVYEERLLPGGELDPLRLAVLADALEEAGCTDADILTHLRSAGPHVRGCWALDLALGKE